MELFNSLTLKKEKFVPQSTTPSMYVCGPTVYSTPHLGNARPAIVFDVLYRTLLNDYNDVTYVRNFTDIDDKIINKSKELGVPTSAVTVPATQEYLNLVSDLGSLRPTHQPTATGSLNEIIRFIDHLVDIGMAYVSGGDIYFDTQRFKEQYPEFVSLTNHDDNDLIEQTRNTAGNKKHNHDFALWKHIHSENPKNDLELGRLFMHPSVGYGRPGWHIECSAMIDKIVGDTLDIHAGGGDLRFPHHQSELMQSYAKNEKPLANYWLHNGMITINGKKMAKSTGQLVTVQEAIKVAPSEAIRFYILKTHYRKPFNWTTDGLLEAKKELDGFYRKISDIPSTNDIIEPLRDDINTPGLIADMHQMSASDLLSAGRAIGIFNKTPDEWFQIEIPNDVNELISQRNDARNAKQWELADKIRDKIIQLGYAIQDINGETTAYKL